MGAGVLISAGWYKGDQWFEKGIIVKLTIIAGACLALICSTAHADQNTKVSVLFQDFPAGTSCGVAGGSGKIAVSTKQGHPKVAQNGYGETGTFACNLPDGGQVVTDVNKRIPVDSRVVGVTVYPNGQTYITASTRSGLVNLEFANTLTRTR